MNAEVLEVAAFDDESRLRLIVFDLLDDQFSGEKSEEPRPDREAVGLEHRAAAVVRIDPHVDELERRRKAVDAQRVLRDDALLIEQLRRLFLRPVLREARSR